MLWHQRLGHIGEKGLQTLHGKGMVEGMSNCTLDFDFCEHFIYGKHNRVRFPSGATRAKGILELIHSDVFGPVHVPSLGKSVYYVSFIDDFSRYTWIYFLRKKSEVFDKFKEFKALVENQKCSGKLLRTDNGGEFYGNEFKEFCKKCGIARSEDYSIHSSTEWSCRKDEHDTDGKIKEHAQWCRVRIGIMGRGSGYNMLLGQSITFINVG
jgi:hypothetical protein